MTVSIVAQPEFPRAEAVDGMCFMPGGDFLMGSNEFYPEERPLRRASVEPFWIDQAPVTNADFETFVADTGYVTLAEMTPAPADFPEADPGLLRPGSAVFVAPSTSAWAAGPQDWWCYVPGACWRNPEGPQSGLDARMDHPVVHIALADAQAYADWCGKTLPTEAEWEFAARGGLLGKPYAWGDVFSPNKVGMANVWTGRFPIDDGNGNQAVRTTAVGSFAPNGFGLVDMIGNVWEWTSDRYSVGGQAPGTCCSVSIGGDAPRVIKGGSFLCAENHCRRYRPAARHAQDPKTSTSHIGFRCVRRH